MNLDDLRLLLQSYPEPICFGGAFFGGTSVTLFLATLAGQQIIPPGVVLFYCALGNLASDCLWYLAGRSKWMESITNHRYVSEGYKKVDQLAARYYHKHLYLFILIKFMYGIRILAILYFGRARYPFKRFLSFDTAAVVIINATVTFSGWMVGKGVGVFLDIFRNVRTAVTFAVAFFVVYYLIRVLIRKFLPRNQDEI